MSEINETNWSEKLVGVVENHEKRLNILMDIIKKQSDLMDKQHEMITNLNNRMIIQQKIIENMKGEN